MGHSPRARVRVNLPHKCSAQHGADLTNPVADFFALRREVAAQSRVMNAWGFLLNVPTLIGGLIFFRMLEGSAVAAAVVVSLLIAGQIHKHQPMSRLIGLCHVVFVPAIVLLATGLTQEGSTALQIWSVYSLTLMTVSVVIDAFDLYRYFVLGSRTYAEHTPRSKTNGS